MTPPRTGITHSLLCQVCVFAFDMLYLNGQSLLQRPLGERRDALHASFEPIPAEFAFAVAKDVMDEVRDDTVAVI